MDSNMDPSSSTPPTTITNHPQDFKKKPKSSPSQIRAQFMSHVNPGAVPTAPDPAPTATAPDKKPTRPLRSTKDVLSRLRYDPAYAIEDFVIGCINRQAGIVDIPAAEWNDGQESQDCIAYFKDVKTGQVVWDRVTKTDLLFA